MEISREPTWLGEFLDAVSKARVRKFFFPIPAAGVLGRDEVCALFGQARETNRSVVAVTFRSGDSALIVELGELDQDPPAFLEHYPIPLRA